MWLRLFPLQSVVLFPGMDLPLVVFEPRYRQLTQECLDDDEPFGVLLLREGQEAGDLNALPFEVGTTARITNIQETPEGRLRLSVTGDRRFRVMSFDRSLPYLSAEAHILDDSPGKMFDPDLAADVREMGSRLIQDFAARRGGWMRTVRLPGDPAALSFFLADFLSGDKGEQQRLLEALTVEERLEQERSLLRGILARMARRSPRGAWKPGFGNN